MVLLLLACVSPPSPEAAWWSINTEETLGVTGDLIGWNIGRGTWYAAQDDPLHPEWWTPELHEAVTQLGSIRAPYSTPGIRFSGLQIDGSLGDDGYHFWDFVDPARGTSDDDNMAVFQYMALIEAADGAPLVTLNFGSGTAGEAADYVTYLEGEDSADPLVAARQSWGRAEPYGARVFEIGNEVHASWNTGYSEGGDYAYANPDALHGGDPDWFGRAAREPSDFAARALAYVSAVTAVLPDAHFRVPLSMADMEDWGGTEAAVAALTPLLEHPAVTAVVVHHYQVDDAVALGLVAQNDPALMVSGSALFAPGFEALRGHLATVDRETPLQVAITEYHVAGFFTGALFEHADDAVLGLGLADMLLAYAAWGIEHADQHMALNFADSDELLFERWYNPFRLDDGEVLAMPSAQVTGLIAEHLRPTTLALEALQVPALSYEGVYDYDAVGAAAFVGDGEVTAVLLNRDLDAERMVRLELPDRGEVTSAQLWAPTDWDQNALEEPVSLVEITPVERRGYAELVLPPHSVAALTIAIE